MIRIPEKYNVLLTFSPIEEITGHWFEVFEYFIFLKSQGFKPFMLFNSIGLKKEQVIDALTDKYIYQYSDYESDILIQTELDTLICAPSCVTVIADGNFDSLERHNIRIICKQVLGFGCGVVQQPFGYYKKAIYLLDTRIYDFPGIHYTKKILKSSLRMPLECISNTAMVYSTANCRNVSLDALQSILSYGLHDLSTGQNTKFENYLILSYNQRLKEELVGNNFTVIEPPVKDLFSKFSTYIYTPVPKKFDCSPRLICECALFNKDVIYYNIDYDDAGLQIRQKDLQSNSVWLEPGDPICSIISTYV